jgi:YD repeat-containing protein
MRTRGSGYRRRIARPYPNTCDEGENLRYYGDPITVATTPSLGALAYMTETTANAAGRITARNLNGRTYNYSYDARGWLIAYTDHQDSSKDATCEYDYLGRRIKMTIGNKTYRMVYDGDDVVAEYIDDNNDGQVDRKRIYWLLKDIDQRLGFVDINVTSVSSGDIISNRCLTELPVRGMVWAWDGSHEWYCLECRIISPSAAIVGNRHSSVRKTTKR